MINLLKRVMTTLKRIIFYLFESDMASINKVILIGNLGADPEIRYTGTGDAICNLRIATTETWKDKTSGEKRESTEWRTVVLFRRLAEIAKQYLAKGSAVYIEGKLKTRKWQDKQGADRYSTEIETMEMTMLGKKGADHEEAPFGTSAQEQDGTKPTAMSRKQAAVPTWLENDTIPF